MTGEAQSPEPLSKSALAKRLKRPVQPLFATLRDYRRSSRTPHSRCGV